MLNDERHISGVSVYTWCRSIKRKTSTTIEDHLFWDTLSFFFFFVVVFSFFKSMTCQTVRHHQCLSFKEQKENRRWFLSIKPQIKKREAKKEEEGRDWLNSMYLIRFCFYQSFFLPSSLLRLRLLLMYLYKI